MNNLGLTNYVHVNIVKKTFATFFNFRFLRFLILCCCVQKKQSDNKYNI